MRHPYKALVTGHSRGLGEAIARALLAQGIPVLGLSRAGNPALVDAFDSLLVQVALDLSNPAALQAWLASDGLAVFGADAEGLLLVNNAGSLGPVAPPGRQDAAALVQAVNLNVSAPLLLCDGVMRLGCPQVRIAHVSSGAARTAYPGWSVYGATKAALDHHARAVQQDAPPGLRISSVAPGVVDTAMQTAVRASHAQDFPRLERFVALKAEGHLSTPEDAARRLVAHLLSDAFGAEPVVDVRELG
jgi:benzil reductase ((S)-benzoin forming)